MSFIATAGAANADTERVNFNHKDPVIGYLAAYNVSDCHTMIFDTKIRKQPKHGRATVHKGTARADKGPCKGRSIVYYAIVYKPNRGFKGQDTLTVGYRAPSRRYYPGSNETLPKSQRYVITVP